MPGKELDTFSKDIDETIDMIIQPMIMVIFMMMLIPMLPVVQSAQQYFRSQQYEGRSASRTLSADGVLRHIVLSDPWVGAFIVNDGPDAVYIMINSDEADPYIIQAGESRTISRVGAENRIYAIYYRCYGGGTATVRIDGVY